MQVTEDRKALTYRSDVLPKGPLVCIADHESNARRFALECLEREGYGVHMFSMDADVIQRVSQLQPLLVIIEMTLSRRFALELCRAVRSVRSLTRTAIVLFLAKTSEEEERILGLEAGADDYITESSSGREVVARVRVLLRRFARQDIHFGMPGIRPPFLNSLIGTATHAVSIGDIEINPIAMKILVRGSEIETTHLEFRLLYYLVHNQSRVFTRHELLDAVWDTQCVELRSVDACVRRLRRKIEPDPLRPIYLKTIRGAGYSLQVRSA